MKHYLYLAGIFTIFTTSCCKEPIEIPEPINVKNRAVATYGEIGFATYVDCYQTALDLEDAVNSFIEEPTALGLEACKAAWRKARIPYAQSEIFRFSNVPIDDANSRDKLVNSWPIDPFYIDYTENEPESGIINNILSYPDISKDLLVDLNAASSATSITTGYHAIEFLLWGQDLNLSSSGNRPYTDYLTGPEGTAENQDRRGQYLVLITELLVDILFEVQEEWAPGAEFRESLLVDSNIITISSGFFESVERLCVDELGGKGMEYPVNEQSQYYEQSNFSDNTTMDIRMTYQGIKNVYFGSYSSYSGSRISKNSFNWAYEARSLYADNRAEAVFVTVDLNMNLLPSPFDQGIFNNQEDITSTVESLDYLHSVLQDVAQVLDAE